MNHSPNDSQSTRPPQAAQPATSVQLSRGGGGGHDQTYYFQLLMITARFAHLVVDDRGANLRLERVDVVLCCGHAGFSFLKRFPVKYKGDPYEHKNMEQVGRNNLFLPSPFSIKLECAHVVGTQHFKFQYNTLYRV